MYANIVRYSYCTMSYQLGKWKHHLQTLVIHECWAWEFNHIQGSVKILSSGYGNGIQWNWQFSLIKNSTQTNVIYKEIIQTLVSAVEQVSNAEPHKAVWLHLYRLALFCRLFKWEGRRCYVRWRSMRTWVWWGRAAMGWCSSVATKRPVNWWPSKSSWRARMIRWSRKSLSAKSGCLR